MLVKQLRCACQEVLHSLPSATQVRQQLTPHNILQRLHVRVPHEPHELVRCIAGFTHGMCTTEVQCGADVVNHICNRSVTCKLLVSAQ